jgi:hypothetical protein
VLTTCCPTYELAFGNVTEDEGRKPDAANGYEGVDEPPGDDGDYALGTLVRLANAGGLSMGVTLFVGGTVVSGLLVGAGGAADKLRSSRLV